MCSLEDGGQSCSDVFSRFIHLNGVTISAEPRTEPGDWFVLTDRPFPCTSLQVPLWSLPAAQRRGRGGGRKTLLSVPFCTLTGIP